MAKQDKIQNEELVNETEDQQVLTDAQIKNQKRQEKLQQKKQAKAKENAKNKKKAKGGEQKPKTNKGKEVVGELKKVTWPTFGQVVKNTLLVIGIVLLITVGLFLFDIIFSWVHQLLVQGNITAWWPWQNI